MRITRYLHKIRRALAQWIHPPRVKIHRDGLVLNLTLILIVFLAFMIRVLPLFLIEPLLKAFDPYVQFRATTFILENGFFDWYSWHDELSWYPWGRDMATMSYPGTPLTGAFLYFLLNLIGFRVDLQLSCYLMPPIFGALTTLTMYFLGKEVTNSKVGLLAALFTAFSPGYIQRTVGGFYDNEAIGVFTVVLTIYFFSRSLKRESLLSGVMAGLSLGYLSASWGASQFILDLIPLYAFLLILVGRYSNRLLTSYTTTMGLGLIIAVAVPRNNVNILLASEGLPGLFVFFIMLMIEARPYMAKYVDSLKGKIPDVVKANIGRILLVTTVLVVVSLAVAQLLNLIAPTINQIQDLLDDVGLFSIGGRFFTVLLPTTRDLQQIIRSVGEHLPTPWGYYFYNLHSLMLFAPIGLYFLFRKLDEVNAFIILLSLLTVYFSGSMIRLILILAPVMCLVGAVGITNLLRPFADVIRQQPTRARRRRLRVQKMVGKEFAAISFIIIFLMLSVQTVWGAHTTLSQATSSIKPSTSQGIYGDWLEGFAYVRNQLPEDAVIASWWDYGYWITGMTNRTTLADNATSNSTQIALIGTALMTTNESWTIEIFEKMGAGYILVHFGQLRNDLAGDEGKWIWMVRISEDVANKRNETWLREEDYFNETNQEIKDLFYNSTLYKMLRLGEPGGAQVDLIGRLMEQNPGWLNHPVFPEDLKFLTLEYASTNRLFKLYKINYTAYHESLIT